MSPRTRTVADSNGSVTVSGWVTSPGQTVTIEAVDQNSGGRSVLGTKQASRSGEIYHPCHTPVLRCNPGESWTVYPWSYETGVLARNYWAPQLSPNGANVPDVATSQGRLELFASVEKKPCPISRIEPGCGPQLLPVEIPTPLGGPLPDEAVLFDPYGVGGAPEGPWTPVAGMIATPPSGTTSPPVAWSVGSYTVGPANPANSPSTIYALICAPTTPGNYPMVVFNHGGINAGPGHDIGSAAVQVNSGDGWPNVGAVDALGLCVDWAKRGWIFAMSSYRAESFYINSSNPAVASADGCPAAQSILCNTAPGVPSPWTSDAPNGGSELCLGEVTDVMALVDLLVNRTSTITLGTPNTTNQLQLDNTTAWNGQLFMYGYSHGGCITYRAVEQGAPVTAFADIEGFTDMSLNYWNGWQACTLLHNAGDTSACPNAQGTGYDPALAAATGAHAWDSNGNPYYPDAAGVMGYNWRSPQYFASRGDLGTSKFQGMPILILHGDSDATYPLPCNPATTCAPANPVPLDHPLELAPDINAAGFFVGPNSFAGCSAPSTYPNGGFPPNEPSCFPTSETCIAPIGAPITDPTGTPLMGVPSSCPVNFTLTTPSNAGSCLGGDPTAFAPTPTACQVISVPPHSLVVYHNMSHINGGYGIQPTFNSFVQQNFGAPPGCSAVPVNVGLSYPPTYSAPMPCNTD